MAKENVVLMQESRDALRGKWKIPAAVTFLYLVISLVVGSPEDVGPLIQLLVGGPLMLGLSIFYLTFSRGGEASVSQLFEGFSDFLRALVAHLWITLFVILWSLLLIVPGIIAAFSYSQTFFIMADDKSISAREAVKKSKAMMMGNKKKLFFLGLRFIGWFALGIITAGIGFLWIMPYFYIAVAKFYDDVSKQAPAAPSSVPSVAMPA